MKKIALASTIATTAFLGTLTSAANAIDFTPQAQGEVNVGLGCLDSLRCLTLNRIFSNIESLVDITTGTKSRLFVDYFGDGDERVTFGTGKSQVVLSPVDAGTKTTGYWFRPSETEPGGGNEEQGQLEVGTYLFEFSKTLSELKIDFFDTESFPTTGVLKVNGAAAPDYVRRGANNNIYSKTFTNVNSLVLKLGEDFPNGTGDGVDFRMSGQPVPEPGSLLGLAAISAGGVLLKKRQAEKV